MVGRAWGEAMKNVMRFSGNYQAVIMYDPDMDMFRGEFAGLNGGADFYAKDLDGLKKEGEISLRVFLDECAARGIEPRRAKGNFSLRLDADTYHAASIAASAKGQSLNQFIAEAVRNKVEAEA
jgi:predicted HicB family RNase H-like nuclease